MGWSTQPLPTATIPASADGLSIFRQRVSLDPEDVTSKV
jgi:hypothetical protein